MRRSLILLLALIAGVATFILLQVSRVPQTAPNQSQKASDAVYALVYSRDMHRGTLVDDAGVKWQQQLRTALPPDAILAETNKADLPAAVEGRLLRRDVLAGEVVRTEVMVDEASSFMALTLTPGMRAVGVAVTPQKLAGGFILPEDRVDVIHTATGDMDGNGTAGSYSQTILANIRVLAVGEQPSGRITFQTATEQEAAAGQPSDVTMKGETVTLEMSEEEAAVLFSAMASGQISLALRALEDHGPPQIVSTLGFEQPAPDKAPALSVNAAQGGATTQAQTLSTTTVRVISGGSANLVEVPLDGNAGKP